MTKRSNRPSGYTFVEILTVVVIIAILASAVALIASGVRKKAERVACSANLGSLHVALHAYLQDNERWPQVKHSDEEEEYWDKWKKVLERYNLPEKVWTCPSHARASGGSEFMRHSSYHPMPFDGNSPMTPYRWKNMPWVIEIGDNHGDGSLVIMHDGSVNTSEWDIGGPMTNMPKR